MRGPYVEPPPERRPLRIFAFDPMVGRRREMRVTVGVKHEPLQRGPRGARIEVIDYDGHTGRYYEPVDLDDPSIVMQDGLEPSESDPRFHQQMVYAVAMRTLENFDAALGRRLTFQNGRPLRVYPHGFIGANAFFDPKTHALVFGYFRGNESAPGETLPGQTVFSCLSHDIIAHETTHAVVHRLRPHFMDPTNLDVLAFHEGFSDIVAILQHFSFGGILRDAIQESRADIRNTGPFVELAREFGHATGGSRALRTAIEAPDAALYRTLEEPHERGSLLVAAVFDAFLHIHERRTRELLRIATNGTGVLPPGDLPADLVNRLCEEAGRTASSILSMCIRAFEYLPPVDITFGDYLRALVTADFELSPDDDEGRRAAIIEAFRIRGIFPDGVTSLAEESLLWSPMENPVALPIQNLRPWLFEETAGYAVPRDERRVARRSKVGVQASAVQEDDGDLEEMVARQLHRWAVQNAIKIGLDPSGAKKISVRGFHPIYRVTRNGLLIELVAQFVQRDPQRDRSEDFGGVPVLGGVTIVAEPRDGRVKYAICKPLPASRQPVALERAAERRLERQRAFVAACDRSDAFLPWGDGAYREKRIKARMNLARLHGARPR